MKDLKFASEEFEADDITVEELEEQLSDELDVDDVELDEVKELDVEDEVKTSEEEEILAEAEELLKAFEAEEEVEEEVKVSEEEEILAECEKLEKEIEAAEETELPDDKEIVAEEEEVIAEDEKSEKEITASEVTPGIEDEIGDEAKGGDPSVSGIVDTKIDVSTDKEVFPTNSEYVARITKRLDRVANILEKRGMKRMAFRVDQLSDKLESSIRK